MVDKEKLNQKLAEFAGLCWHDWQSDEDYFGVGHRCTKCGERDSQIGIYSKPQVDFTASLDLCFRHLGPKVHGPEAAKRCSQSVMKLDCESVRE